MDEDTPPVSVHMFTSIIDYSIELGALVPNHGSCWLCHTPERVYWPHEDIKEGLDPTNGPIPLCRDCLLHRAMWNAYQTHVKQH